jgi:transposase
MCVVARRVSPEQRERIVRVARLRVPGDDRSEWRRFAEVASQFGVSQESVRMWVRQAEIDAGEREGIPTAAEQEIAELKARNAELEVTIEILKAAASFFAREYDPRPTQPTGSSTSTGNGSESYRSAER